MKHKKLLGSILTSLCFLVNLFLPYYFNGIALRNLPKAESVDKVKIVDNTCDNHSCIVTDTKEITTAVNLLSLANYRLGSPTQGTPIQTITYCTEDGTESVLSINETTVWWNGKSYPLKQEGLLTKLITNYFFPSRT